MKNKIKAKNVIWVIALIVMVVLVIGVGIGYFRKIFIKPQNPIAIMEVQDYGTIKMELYPEIAPETVSNFIALTDRGFYNGLTFHRIVKDFMIQGGDKKGDGTGTATEADIKEGGSEDKEYTIKGEFIANGVKNNKLKFEEGVIGLARSDYSQYSSDLKEESYNSGNSQFFIVTKESASLNGYYTAFGKVIEGMDIVHKIEETEVKAADDGEETGNTEVSTPVNAPVIKEMKIEKNGGKYDLPKLLEPFNYTSWMYKQYGIDPSSFATSE